MSLRTEKVSKRSEGFKLKCKKAKQSSIDQYDSQILIESSLTAGSSHTAIIAEEIVVPKIKYKEKGTMTLHEASTAPKP